MSEFPVELSGHFVHSAWTFTIKNWILTAGAMGDLAIFLDRIEKDTFLGKTTQKSAWRKNRFLNPKFFLKVFPGITHTASSGCIKSGSFRHDLLKYFMNCFPYLNDEAILRNPFLAWRLKREATFWYFLRKVPACIFWSSPSRTRFRKIWKRL